MVKDYNIKKFHTMNVQPVLVFGKKMTQMNGYIAQTLTVVFGVMLTALNKVNRHTSVCYAKPVLCDLCSTA